MLLTNIGVNKACTTERANRYFTCCKLGPMPIIIIIIMLQIISRVNIAQWLKLPTSNRVLYGHEFESQTDPPPPPPPTHTHFLFYFIFFFWLALFSCFLPYQVCTLHNPRISRDSQMSNKIVFTKQACCQFTFNSIVIMATLLGASENETRNYLHYSNESKKINE